MSRTLRILILVAGVVLVFVGAVWFKELSTWIASQNPEPTTSTRWLTYSNEVFGFRVSYPPTCEVRVNDPYGKRNPTFDCGEPHSDLAPMGLYLDFNPIFYAPRFDPAPDFGKPPEGPVDEISILVTDRAGEPLRGRNGQQLYAACVVYGSGTEVIHICNRILATLEIIK